MKMWSHSDAEFNKMLEIINKTKRETFLEIGTHKFGMTGVFLLMAVGRNPLVIGIDKIDASPGKRELLKSYYKESFYWIHGSSYDINVRTSVIDELRNRKLDILYIDGDHSDKGVEADTENHTSLVDDEGYIIWHDTLRGAHEGVHKYFLKKLGENFQINMFFENGSRIGYIQAKERRRNAKGNIKD